MITVKGLALLRRADVVVYDQLANPELLKEVPAGAEMLYVGKKAGRPRGAPGRHQRVVGAKSPGRAHGGAPQGRRPLCLWPGGAEETEELVGVGIPFEIVPGVTSAAAGASLRRDSDYPPRVHHLGDFYHRPRRPDQELHHTVGGPGVPGTLVFPWGSKPWRNICRRLVALGRSPETPVAVIQ